MADQNRLPSWRPWALPVLMLGLSAPLWLQWNEPALFIAINQACLLLPAPVWTGLSLLGNAWGVLAVTSPLLVLAPRLLWAWLCAVPFGVVFARLGKGLLDSPRPAAMVDSSVFRLVGEKLEVASMPSGHTLTAFAVASSLYFALDAPGRARFAWLWLLAGGVGLSRIAVGAHWPGDVAVGAGLGVLAGLLGNLLWRRLGAVYGDPQGWRLRAVALLLAATVYVLLDGPLDFAQNTPLQQVLAVVVVGTLAVFVLRQRASSAAKAGGL
jgi:membrane-associated phospholipid phosphatase